MSGVTQAPFCSTWGAAQVQDEIVQSAVHPVSAGLAMHWATVTAVLAQAPGLAAHSAAHPEREGLKEHCARVTVPGHVPGLKAHSAVQPVNAGLIEQLAMVAVTPVQTGSAGLALQDASRAAQPTIEGVAVHCA